MPAASPTGSRASSATPPLEVHIVDLGAKGTWYRVLLPANSASAANTACANIKNAGGDCLIALRTGRRFLDALTVRG